MAGQMLRQIRGDDCIWIFSDNAEAILKEEIGRVFLEVLRDAGVFKRTPEGKAAFIRFIDFAK